jgi:hypothetical protein
MIKYIATDMAPCSPTDQLDACGWVCAGIVTMFCWPCFDTDVTGFSKKFPGTLQAHRGFAVLTKNMLHTLSSRL